ncbi:MAG: hypothetical protein KC593_01060 [Myxococcales bacterium]|nr:hypothetical protein [Myxococcales bacterium]MCB9629136.1 hypothetical protein [Sandaracinaceae bacterium]
MSKKILFTSLLLALTAVVGLPVAGTSSPLAPSRAQADACSGVTLDDAVRQQVYAPGAAFAARPIRETVFLARALQPVRTMGATVHVHAQPGMTRQYLERALECHVRSGQAVNPSDPLVVPGGAVRDVDVLSAGGAFALRIQGDSPAAGRAIFERAESLVGGTVSVQQL